MIYIIGHQDYGDTFIFGLVSGSQDPEALRPEFEEWAALSAYPDDTSLKDRMLYKTRRTRVLKSMLGMTHWVKGEAFLKWLVMYKGFTEVEYDFYSVT